VRGGLIGREEEKEMGEVEKELKEVGVIHAKYPGKII